MAENKALPRNVGIIMDGNGRWAKRRLLPRSAGHDAGMKRIIKLVKHVRQTGIKYLTLYALSTENLARPKEELEGLYSLFRMYFEKYAPQLTAENSAVSVIGDLSALPQDVAEKMRTACARSPQNPDFTNFAAELGGNMTEQSFAKLLYTADIPDPDLIIRTGGELRLSNFLLWQSAYAELYFTDVLFPDFTAQRFDKAIEEFSRRSRRFGKV